MSVNPHGSVVGAPRIARVILLRRTQALAEPFDYLVPDHLVAYAREGQFAFVPFGTSEAMGIIAELTDRTAYTGRLRELADVVDHGLALPSYAIPVARRMARHYVSSVGLCVAQFAPPLGSAMRAERALVLTKQIDTDGARFLLAREGRAAWREFVRELGPRAEAEYRELRRRDAVRTYCHPPDPGVRPSVEPRAARHILVQVADRDALEKARRRTRSDGLRAAIDHLLAVGYATFEELQDDYGVTRRQLDALARSGGIAASKRVPGEAMASTLPPGSGWDAPPVALTPHQRAAVDAIVTSVRAGDGALFLLHGVTGSGKTEVYTRAIEAARRAGKGSIYLVPEIALTRQTIGRVERAIGTFAVEIHSSMDPSVRYFSWYEAALEPNPVVVGARSAVFAPVAKLGLIVVDEEHEPAYKHGSSPPYDARTVAEWIAAASGATVVFGSATPSVERMYRARNGEIRFLTLPERISGRVPRIEIVDLRRERALISSSLREKMLERVRKQEKTILFLNRRGYSVVAACDDCGRIEECPNCAVPLRYHSDVDRLVCHHCGARRALPSACAACGSPSVRLRGAGTQRLEKELREIEEMAEAEVLRVDSDVGRRTQLRKSLIAFVEAGAAVMVGTQMIAKGFHFPDVTLVGVVNADVSLHLPDFRAEERTFQLLSQVIGRTARGDRPGEVVVQTWNPERDVIRQAVTGDFDGFYEREFEMRRTFGYPPFVNLTRVVCSSANAERAHAACEEIAAKVGEHLSTVLGPMPCAFPKLSRRYRFHCVLKTEGELPEEVRAILFGAVRKPRAGVTVRVDVDPMSML